VARSQCLSILIQIQIRTFVDVNPLLDTVIDCSRFVTRLFEIISLSGPHIYHSALQLASPSSMVRKLYTSQIHSLIPRVAIGVAASEDSCTASVRTSFNFLVAIWSPCGRFIAVFTRCPEVNIIEVRDSDTLEVTSTLKPVAGYITGQDKSISFSPDGRLLACSACR